VTRRAAIDVGTNSVRLLVADVAHPPGSALPVSPASRRPASAADSALRPVLRHITITRLGDGLEPGGAIRPDAAERTAAVVRAYLRRAAATGAAPPVVAGTHALRVARNPEALLGKVGAPVRVLTAEEEARLGFRGALAGLPAARRASRVLVVDIGGGSVEVAWGSSRDIEGSRSLPLGCVVLTRMFLAHDPPLPAEVAALRAHVARALDPVLAPLRRLRSRLVGVGGTITAMAALAQRLSPYDPDRVHGYRLPASRARALTASLLAQPLAARRRLPGLAPERADVIGAGALVLEHLLGRLGRRSIVVSEADLLWALVLEPLPG